MSTLARPNLSAGSPSRPGQDPSHGHGDGRLFGGQRAPDGSLVADNFSRWFGASAATGQDNRPQVLYHATRESFDQFDRSRIGTGYNRFGPGFYFTADTKTLDVFSTGDAGLIMPVYLSVQSPATSMAMRIDQVDAFFDALRDVVFANGYDAQRDHAELRAQALADPDEALSRVFGATGIYISQDDFVRGMDAAGFDGVIQKVFGSLEYMVLRPQQIKSAIGNSGMYDPDCADMADEDAWGVADSREPLELDTCRPRERMVV